MCGIVGFVGRKEAAPILLEGLRRLEYRGYDSAGVAVYGSDGLQVVKTKGRIQALAEQVDARGGLIMPGLINLHHHAGHTLARGLLPRRACPPCSRATGGGSTGP